MKIDENVLMKSVCLKDMPFIKISGVYRIEINKYFYVGQSTNVFKRIKRHISNCKSGKSNSLMMNEFNKGGELKFYYLEMPSSSDIERVDLESKIIVYYKHLGKSLNKDIGRSPCKETRKLISDNYKGKFVGKCNGNYGNKWTNEQKNAQSLKLKESHKRRCGNLSEKQLLSYSLRKPKINNDKILEIIFRLENEEYIPKETCINLAEEFKTSIATIYRIRRRERPFDKYK